MFKTTMSRPTFDPESLDHLGRRWRKLAAASPASYFQDWGWVGCMAVERYRHPILLEITRAGEPVGLALFNRKRSGHEGGTLHLQESTDPALGSIFVEHNGPLLAITDPVLRQALLADLFGQAMRGSVDGAPARRRRIVVSGVGPDCADAMSMTGGTVGETSSRVAPYSDFRTLDPAAPFIETLSRNTRHQLRRSSRLYEADGALAVTRAETVDQGRQFLDEMIAFHDSTWKARGKKGAFATPLVRRFYGELLETGIPLGEVDMLKVTAGPVVIGLLMNFVHRGVVSAYQSGFNYAAAGPHQKPGLTCHYLAIEGYRKRGLDGYDFLAGADRYKLSLANAQRQLHWTSAAPAWHPASLGSHLRNLLGF